MAPPQPQPRSSRRSRSHHRRSPSRRPDKRPISIHRSPRRRSTHRRRRSSRRRSTSRDAPRRRQDSRSRARTSSVHLRSASPRRRAERQQQEEYYRPHDTSHTQPILQASSQWTHQQNSNTTTQSPQPNHYLADSNDTWQSWGKWKDYSKHPSQQRQSHWTDYSSWNPQVNQSHGYSSKPLTAFSSTHTAPPRHKQHSTPAASGDDQSVAPTDIPDGHMPINVHSGSTAECQRLRKCHLS